jgi:hypothetical protein
MSDEGIRLVARTLLVGFLIVVAAIFRTLVGPGRRRGEIMLAGTLGGISFGVLVAYLISKLFEIEASAVCACLGMTLGWCVSWRFARQIPREASRPHYREASMRHSPRKQILLAVIVLVALVALRMFGLLRDFPPVAY